MSVQGAWPPKEINFSSLNQKWCIYYLDSKIKTVKLISRPHQELVVYGNAFYTTCYPLLVTWIKRYAKIHLTHWLAELSAQTNLSFTTVAIRGQKGRWGSCSEKKSINLNYKLLFLPLHLVKHVLLHELCHTLHLNHSKHFWQLMSAFDVQFQENRQQLSKAEKWLPAWL